MDSAVSTAGCRYGIVVIFYVGLLVGPAAFADDSGWDRFTLTVSGYNASIDTQVRLDSSNLVPGTSLDLEDDLQLDDSETMTQYYASLRIMDRVSLEGSYFELGRFAETTLNGSIQFGDTVFPVNVDATTSFAAEVATAGLRWAFLHSEKLEMAATAGIYWMSMTAGIDTTDTGLAEQAEASSVLPMVGLYLGWNLTPKLQFTLNGDYLSIDYTDFEGSLINLRAGLRYLILSNVGLGIGYDALEIEVESSNDDFSGLVNYRQQGPKLFMSIRF